MGYPTVLAKNGKIWGEGSCRRIMEVGEGVTLPCQVEACCVLPKSNCGEPLPDALTPKTSHEVLSFPEAWLLLGW